MSKYMLFEYELQEGKRYIDALCEVMHVHSSLWVFTSDWHLVLALPLCDEIGSLETYKEVLRVFTSMTPPLRIRDSCIKVLSPNDEVIKSLTEVQKAYNITYTDRHIKGGYHGKYIDEAYVYFVDRTL